MINLPKKWKIKYWKTEKDAFKGLFELDGPVFNEKNGRRTFRFKLGNKYSFGKFHKGVGWKKIIKNILQFSKPPVLSAQNAWKAIQKLDSLGVDTMHRVQIRNSTPWRLRAKDSSAIMFSSMDIGLTKEDLLLFAQNYYNTTVKNQFQKIKFSGGLLKGVQLDFIKNNLIKIH